MKKLAPLAFFLAISMNLFFACEESELPQEEEMIAQEDEDAESATDPDESEDSADNSNSEEEETENDTTSGTEVTLIATPNIISNNGIGPQNWSDEVSIEAFKIDGSQATLVFDTEFRDEGFGVAGARWNQIDYYVMYQGEEVNASEKVVISFQEGALDITLTVGMMGANEGHPDGETGKWTAFDQEGNQIAEGVLGANESNLGREVKLDGDSYGIYPIDLESNQPIYRLEVEATGFGYGTGDPENRNYDDESGNQENNSDFNIVGISYSKH